MKVSELLSEAKSLISNPENWTQGALARNKLGCRVSEMSNVAACFCSIGALRRAALGAGAPYFIAETAALILGSRVGYGWSISAYNDTHSHSEVMAVWDEAIEMAKSQEGK